MGKLHLALLALLVLPTALGRTQEHAPTVDQCRADSMAWALSSDDADDKKLSVHELMRRRDEMVRCNTIYNRPDPDRFSEDAFIRYSLAANRYVAEINDRMADFIE